jgi:hypothetical protein
MNAKIQTVKRLKGANNQMEYKIKVKEIDEGASYSLLELSGLTGLGQSTLRRLIDEGKLQVQNNEEISGKEFLNWSHSVNDTIEVD